MDDETVLLFLGLAIHIEFRYVCGKLLREPTQFSEQFYPCSPVLVGRLQYPNIPTFVRLTVFLNLHLLIFNLDLLPLPHHLEATLKLQFGALRMVLNKVFQEAIQCLSGGYCWFEEIDRECNRHKV